MVNIRLWHSDPNDMIPHIENQHREAWSKNKFYLHYPVLQRWKLKTKDQHLKSIRYAKGKNFVCKWCPNRNCNRKINTMEDFYDHITDSAMRRVTFSMLTENQYRQRRGWQPVDESAAASSSTPSTSKKTAKATKASTTKRKAKESTQTKKRAKNANQSDDSIEEESVEEYLNYLESKKLNLKHSIVGGHTTLSYETYLTVNQQNNRSELKQLLDSFVNSLPNAGFSPLHLNISISEGD